MGGIEGKPESFPETEEAAPDNAERAGLLSRLFRREPDIKSFLSNHDIPRLTAALGDRRPRVRKLAVDAFGALGDATAIEPVSELVDDSEASVRESVVQTLGSLDGERVIKPIAERLTDDSLDVRLSAMNALNQLADNPDHVDLYREILPLLESSLRRESGVTKERQLEDELAKEKPEEFIIKSGRRVEKKNTWNPDDYDAMEDRLEERFLELEEFSLAIVEKIGGPEAVEFIYKRFLDRHATVESKGECIRSLVKLHGAPPQELLDQADVEKSFLNWDVIRRKDETASVADKIKITNEKEKISDLTASLATLSQFAAFDPKSWELILKAFKHGQPEIHVAGIRALGRTQDARALQILQDAYHEEPYTYTVWKATEGPEEREITDRVNEEIGIAIKLLKEQGVKQIEAPGEQNENLTE